MEGFNELYLKLVIGIICKLTPRKSQWKHYDMIYLDVQSFKVECLYSGRGGFREDVMVWLHPPFGPHCRSRTQRL